MPMELTITEKLPNDRTATAFVRGDDVGEMLADLKKVFPDLALGAAEAPVDGKPAEPAPARRARTKKDEPKQDAAKDPAPETAKEETAVEIPDIEDLRAKLKKLGATDGLGHDKVFELLGKYGAKNASTVAEDKRAALIADIDALLEGAK